MSFDFAQDPFVSFHQLYNEAVRFGDKEAHAMTLATVDHQGFPSCRIVYHKGFIRGGFAFYTNYQGKKSLDIAQNPNVALNFFWSHLHVQFRVQGQVDQLTAQESDDYFKSRPRLSQIGAWASKQSEALDQTEDFQKRIHDFEQKFANLEVPRPPHWGGFRVIPQMIEIWIGKEGRLHERFIFENEHQNSHLSTMSSIQSFSDYQWKRSRKYP